MRQLPGQKLCVMYAGAVESHDSVSPPSNLEDSVIDRSVQSNYHVAGDQDEPKSPQSRPRCSRIPVRTNSSMGPTTRNTCSSKGHHAAKGAAAEREESDDGDCHLM